MEQRGAVKGDEFIPFVAVYVAHFNLREGQGQ
jgi:hypothetical protein